MKNLDLMLKDGVVVENVPLKVRSDIIKSYAERYKSLLDVKKEEKNAKF